MNPRNPFYVLELPSTATPGDIERQGKKLLGLFEVGAERARTYSCVLGTFPRDPTMIREATAALRDPKRRGRDACLVRLLEQDADASPPETKIDADAPFADAFLVAGLRGL